MSSLRNEVAAEEEDTSAVVTPNVGRRKLFGKLQCLCPRRYTMAMLLFLLLLLKQWRFFNSAGRTLHAFLFETEEHSIAKWGDDKLENFFLMDICLDLFVQIPSALLIFTYGSHKCLLASAVVSSILHMLLPVALNHHSNSLIILKIAEAIAEAPIFIAVYSTLRYWAPPLERTRLVIFSLSGSFIIYAFLPIIIRAYGHWLNNLFLSNESLYISGIAGLIWALLWYNIASDTPQNDPFISEKELQYLEDNIPSDNQAGRRLKDIPWKSIVTSRPIIILCIISVKMSLVEQTKLENNISQMSLSIVVMFLVASLVILLGFPILTDFLIKKFRGRILLIRKCFLCGGFILNFCFLIGSLCTTEVAELVTIAYIMFLASLPGFMTLPLDLSLRYVSIIAGVMYTFFYGGLALMHVLQDDLNYSTNFLGVILIIEAIFTVLCAALFAKWGDSEEQSWSLSSP